MNIWTLIGKSISAIFMGSMLGALSLLILSHFFPSTSPANAQFSTIGIFGGTVAGLIGIYTGWQYALDVADEAASKLIELLFLGLGIVILGAIAFVAKQFS